MPKVPEADIYGRYFTERDRRMLGMFLRDDGASLEELHRLTMTRVPGYSYIRDARRLAERLGGTAWWTGEGDARKFGIRLPQSERP
jgi:hypothetical protein